MQDKIAVIGGGSWGTSLASLISENGYEVTLFALEEEVVKSINKNHMNKVFLKDVKLNENLKSKLLD